MEGDTPAQQDPTGRISPSEAGAAARELAKGRLFEKVSRAERNAVALEHSDLDRTDQKVIRRARTGHGISGPKVGSNAGLERRFSLTRHLLRRHRAWIDNITPAVLERFAARADQKDDTAGAESWRDKIRSRETARGRYAEMASLSDRAVSEVRALDLSQAVKELAAVAPDMRADGLHDEADVFSCRLELLASGETPDLLPLSDVVVRLPHIGSPRTAGRLWEAAVAWVADHDPDVWEDVREILAACLPRGAGFIRSSLAPPDP